MAGPRPRLALVLALALVAAGCTSVIDGVTNQFREDRTNEWAHSMTQTDRLHQKGWTGDGVKVAVVDTGFDESHNEFSGVKAQWRDFVNGQRSPYDDGGHGTHVTGLAVARAGQSGNPDIAGFAPDADLLHAKAIEGSGEGDSSDVADAIDWTVNNGADVLVLSLGGAPSTLPIGRSVENSVRNAIQAGVVVVAAAGNAQEGQSGTQCDVASPATVEGVIAVGAVNRSGVIADFSCQGDQERTPLPTDDRQNPNKKPEVSAPGVALIGPWPGRSCAGQQQARYCLLSGTSQAAPIVGGIVAGLLEKHTDLQRQDKDAVMTIKKAFMNTAEKRGFGGHHDRYGYGIVQADDALTWLNRNN